MKIAILSLWAQKLFRPEEPQPFGGAELQLKILATAFSEKPETEVHFITRGQGPKEIFTCGKIIVHKLPCRTNSMARMLLGSYDILKELRSLHADVYIQRGSGIETWLTAQTASVVKTPFIFMTSHDMDTDGTCAKIIGKLSGFFYRQGLRKTNWIITQSIHQQEMIKKVYGRESSVLCSSHVIPEHIPSHKDGVLWISRCEKWKNPEAFLSLVAQNSKIPFTMVCPKANDQGYFEHIREEAKKNANLHFYSGLPFEETEQLFASHKLFINTSKNEGFPNTFVQATKWGTPILSLQVNPDNILNRHKIGLFADGDEACLNDSLKELYNIEELWKQFSQNARNYAKENHDVEKNANGFYAILAKTILE